LTHPPDSHREITAHRPNLRPGLGGRRRRFHANARCTDRRVLGCEPDLDDLDGCHRSANPWHGTRSAWRRTRRPSPPRVNRAPYLIRLDEATRSERGARTDAVVPVRRLTDDEGQGRSAALVGDGSTEAGRPVDPRNAARTTTQSAPESGLRCHPATGVRSPAEVTTFAAYPTMPATSALPR